jgi:hypothetical protein
MRTPTRRPWIGRTLIPALEALLLAQHVELRRRAAMLEHHDGLGGEALFEASAGAGEKGGDLQLMRRRAGHPVIGIAAQ